MWRWIGFLLAVAAGIGLGLLYGWVISPVQYTDTAPDTLRADYRADYVLMVAEIYHHEHDPSLAAQRLAFLGSEAPSRIAAEGLDFALQHGYAPADVAMLQELAWALLTWQPAAGGVP
jgi:hypothetical protein